MPKKPLLRPAAFCMLLVVSLLLFTGCENNKTRKDDVLVLNTTEKFSTLINNTKQNTLLIDVRKPADFETGHIAGAINIPVAELYASDMRLSRAKNIVVYSHGWQYQRPDRLSWAAATKLLTLGYKNVYDFRGGVLQWEANGHQLVE